MARERDINNILEDKVEKFRDRVEENVGKIRERVEDVRERFEDVAEKAKLKGEEAWKKGEEGWNDVAKFTQKHPGKALGLAALIGVAIGAVFFGRKRD